MKSLGEIPIECEDFVKISKPKIKRKKRFHKRINIIIEETNFNDCTNCEESRFENGTIVCFGSQKKSFFSLFIGNLT